MGWLGSQLLLWSLASSQAVGCWCGMMRGTMVLSSSLVASTVHFPELEGKNHTATTEDHGPSAKVENTEVLWKDYTC